MGFMNAADGLRLAAFFGFLAAFFFAAIRSFSLLWGGKMRLPRAQSKDRPREHNRKNSIFPLKMGILSIAVRAGAAARAYSSRPVGRGFRPEEITLSELSY